MTDELEREALIDEFKRAGQMPLLWQWTAREFICAGNILLRALEDPKWFDATESPDGAITKPVKAMWLLYGLALENLLKGVLVARGSDATKTGKLNKTLKNHDLVRLWRSAGLPESEATDELLKNLRWSIEPGKYPVGTRPDAQAPAPMWVSLMNARDVLRLVEQAEDALRTAGQHWALPKTNLANLCRPAG